jgi:hypothetical protein
MLRRRVYSSPLPALGGLFNPLSLPALVAWWSADDLANGAVSSWPDRISGLSLAQASGTLQPVRAATSFNSAYPGVTADGVDDEMTCTSFGSIPTGATEGWMFAVSSMTAGASLQSIVNYGTSAASSARRLVMSAGEAPQVSDSTVLISGTNSTANAPHVLAGHWVGTTENGFFNDTAFAGNPGTIASLNTPATRIRIFASAATAAAQFGTGVIRNVMITLALTTLERQRLTAWLAWDCGLQASLDAGNPYVTSRP